MLSASPTPDEVTRYTAWLTEAENAYARLMTGAAEVSVSYNGETVSYSPASRNLLRAWIADLRRALGKPKAINPGIAFKPIVHGRNPARGGGLF